MCVSSLSYWFVVNQLVLCETKFVKFILKLLPVHRMDKATEESQLCSCPQVCTPILKGATGIAHTCPWCPVIKILTQWEEMQHLHYFRHLEIKNFIIQILLAQGQICQLNAHLLVTEEIWEATSQNAAYSRLELLSTALTPKEFSF